MTAATAPIAPSEVSRSWKALVTKTIHSTARAPAPGGSPASVTTAVAAAASAREPDPYAQRSQVADQAEQGDRAGRAEQGGDALAEFGDAEQRPRAGHAEGGERDGDAAEVRGGAAPADPAQPKRRARVRIRPASRAVSTRAEVAAVIPCSMSCSPSAEVLPGRRGGGQAQAGQDDGRFGAGPRDRRVEDVVEAAAGRQPVSSLSGAVSAAAAASCSYGTRSSA